MKAKSLMTGENNLSAVLHQFESSFPVEYLSTSCRKACNVLMGSKIFKGLILKVEMTVRQLSVTIHRFLEVAR